MSGVRWCPVPCLPAAATVLIVLAGSPAALSAQAISGTVIDASTRAPIAGATITIVDLGGRDRARALTDSAGSFRTPLGVPGDYTLRAEQVGYASVATPPVRVGPRELVTVELRLGPRPVELEPLVVQGRAPYRPDGLDEYRRRLQQHLVFGFGRVITREQIERAPTSTVSSLLQREISVRVHYQQINRVIMMRGGSTGECAPVIYLDGMYMGSSRQTDLDAFVSPSSIEGIEIYRDVEAPAEFRTDGCGAIAVWSRRGSGAPFSWWRAVIGGALGAILIVLTLR